MTALRPLILALAVGAAACAVFPTDAGERERAFCITQNEGQSLLCCPSPGLGCQAVEATQ